MSDVRIRNLMNPPPGGKFFWEHDGEIIEARYWFDMEPRVLAHMRQHGMVGDPARIVAEYMCPHMPDWYCSGGVNHSNVIRVQEAKTTASPYFQKSTVAFDELSRRLQICSRCPMHQRSFCLTCTGILDWVQAGFGGRRVRVPEDKPSGVCQCAKTFESVIAAVDYTDEGIWEGVPDTCWRRSK